MRPLMIRFFGNMPGEALPGLAPEVEKTGLLSCEIWRFPIREIWP